MSNENFMTYDELLAEIKDTPDQGIGSFYKENPTDQIWWIDTSDRVGVFLFSFDKEIVFNLFSDYPYKLTLEQKTIFDKENPYWAEFFKERTEFCAMEEI